MRLAMVLCAAAMSAASGCSAISVYVEHDPTVNFAELKRYSWVEEASMGTAPIAENPILDSRVRLIVDQELAARGYEKITGGTPDFLVGYSAAVDTELQAVTINRYYGYTQSTYLTRAGTGRNYPRETMNRQTVVYEYQQGTLILDFSSPVPHRLIWRGFARAVIEPDQPQEQRDKQLREAVRKMLESFPP